MAGSIIIVGVGPFVSLSLTRRLASLGWRIALISRSEEKLEMVAKAAKSAISSSEAPIFCQIADAGDPAQLMKALDRSRETLGSVDCVLYNAARVGKHALINL